MLVTMLLELYLVRGKTKPFHVIYYASNLLNKAQQNYTTIEKEILVVVFVFDKLRVYMLGTEVIVHTDLAVIRYLMNKEVAKPTLIRWIFLLSKFHIEIRDKKVLRTRLQNICQGWKNQRLISYKMLQLDRNFQMSKCEN